MYLKRSRMARTLILALTLMGLACSDDDPSDDMPPMDGGPVADSGPDGGPGGKGMVPGLYMFSAAFSEARFGYACALGMVLFVIILLLTIVYQKYVKVEK